MLHGMAFVKLTNTDADVFVPDGRGESEALARTTHMVIGAHQDDIEFMALHAILACYNRADRWLTGVTMTDGAGSPRSGPYADYSDEEMRQVRLKEQRTAAVVGGYTCQIQLMFPSSVTKDPSARGPVQDLQAILELATPEFVYLHSPADKHDTHVASFLRALAALRSLPQDRRPTRVYGCEMWRDLDWLMDEDKRVLPVDDRENVGTALTGLYDSQISGGKRYDLAIQGRHVANATFLESHAVDEHTATSFAMDLTPLVSDPSEDVGAFTSALLRRTEQDIRGRLARLGSGA